MADLPELPPGQRWLRIAVNVPDCGKKGYDQRLINVIRNTAADAAEQALLEPGEAERS